MEDFKLHKNGVVFGKLPEVIYEMVACNPNDTRPKNAMLLEDSAHYGDLYYIEPDQEVFLLYRAERRKLVSFVLNIKINTGG